jgi:hypothetical protein
MNAALDQLSRLELLVLAARKSRIQPTDFAAGMFAAMQEIQALLVQNPSSEFLDADFVLCGALDDYEKNPGLTGVSKIGNALVRYRGAARQSAQPRHHRDTLHTAEGGHQRN